MERQFDLFVRMKGNVDAVQSKVAPDGGLTLARERASRSKVCRLCQASKNTFFWFT
jgi:hypothetical protein